ncbi:MAG: hypothetical protein EA383_06325 [Spirochaetaceae bacterium]|nr:MAG: hypothetical protein EA383_06325 [Spirochaetaceae bacterium]
MGLRLGREQVLQIAGGAVHPTENLLRWAFAQSDNRTPEIRQILPASAKVLKESAVTLFDIHITVPSRVEQKILIRTEIVVQVICAVRVHLRKRKPKQFQVQRILSGLEKLMSIYAPYTAPRYRMQGTVSKKLKYFGEMAGATGIDGNTY